MQTKCLNPDYKQQEAKVKQLKCLNADYKKMEAEAKKAKHFNPDFKQKETKINTQIRIAKHTKKKLHTDIGK